MQRALSELERTGVIYTQRTSGRFVTQDESLIRSLKETAAKEAAADFMEKMKELGLELPAVLLLIKEYGGTDNERDI